MASNRAPDGYRWRFNQLGGFDQVVIIDSAEDILHLPELNQKRCGRRSAVRPRRERVRLAHARVARYRWRRAHPRPEVRGSRMGMQCAEGPE